MNVRTLRASRRGFTLIELLTVIAIIGILAAILIPTVGRVRDQARFARGQSNIRQWALANLLFADANKGWFPHDGGGSIVPANNILVQGVGCWWNEIPPYIDSPTVAQLATNGSLPQFGQNSLYVCPKAEPQPGVANPAAWLNYGPSFAMSRTGGSGWLTNLKEIREHTRTVMFSELTNNAPGSTGTFGNANPRFLSTQNRWNGKALLSFFDGNVRSFTTAQLTDHGRSGSGNAAYAVNSSQRGDNADGVIWVNPRVNTSGTGKN